MKFENPSTIIDAEMQKQQAERKKRLEKISTANADNLSDEDLELRKKEIYQEGDEYTENSVGEGQFEYRVTPGEKRGAPEKKLTDEEYGELQESFIDRLPRSEAGSAKKKKIDTEGDTSDKAGEQAKEAVETETWETLKNVKYQTRERNPMVGGRRFGKNKETITSEPGETPEKTEARLEQESKLEALKSLVAEKRKAYATADYNAETVFSKIKGVLGLKNENMPANGKDSLIYQQYQGALNELRSLQIQMMRDKYADIDNLPPTEKAAKTAEMRKEMGEMATYFGVCEKLDLAGARTNARTEAWAETKMGRFGEKALKRSAEVINWYRKLDPKIKIALSISLMAGGLGAAAMGSFGVASVVGGTKLLQRWLGGAALGVGIAGGLEARSRNKVNQKAEKGRNAIFENPEAGWQEQFQALNEYCGKEMRGFHSGLQDEKYGATRRKLLGAGVGVFVGSGAAADCLKYGFGKIGETETFGKLKDVAAGLWKSSGASGIIGAGIENIKAHSPFSSSVDGDLRLHDTAGAKTPSAPKEAFSSSVDGDLRLHPTEPGARASVPKEAFSSSVDGDLRLHDTSDAHGLKDSPSSKLASKLSGMYDEISDKVKGAAIKFEKDYLQGTPSPDNASSEVGAGSSAHEFFNSGDVEIPKGSSIEKEIIKRMQELKIPKAEAGKYAHRMVLRFIEASDGQTTLEKLNLVKPGEIISFNIDPNNLDNSNIANFRGIAGPSIDISHAGGVAIDDARMTAITEQMEKEALERGETIGGQHSIDDRISDQMEKEAAERNRPFIKNHTIGETNVADMNPENMPDPRGSLVPDTSAENMPDPRGAEPIQSEAEILPTEMANIEKIADIFGNRSFGGNNLAEQIADARNLTGAEFDRAYENIFRNIIGNTFNESGVNNLNAREYLEGNNSKIESLIQFNSEHFTDYSIEPKATETMGSWMSRNIAKALEACGVGYNRFKI